MDTSTQFPQTSASPETPKQKGSNKGVALAIIILSLLLAAALALLGWLYATNKIHFIVANQPGADGASLCQDVIAQYNAGFNEADLDAYTDSLRTAAEKARAADPNTSDPNCTYMQFSYAAFAKDLDETKRLASALRSLADQGAYITGELANPQSILAIENTVKQLENVNNPAPADDTVEGNG